MGLISVTGIDLFDYDPGDKKRERKREREKRTICREASSTIVVCCKISRLDGVNCN
jgi:hypothetical protein